MNPHHKPQEDVVGLPTPRKLLGQAYRDNGDLGAANYVEMGHDLIPDTRIALLAIRDALALDHEAGRRDMREAAGWQPITKETPEVERCLLWCTDLGMGGDVEGVCLGRIFINWDGFPKAKANGKMGDWKYTHWRALPTEPLGGEG